MRDLNLLEEKLQSYREELEAFSERSLDTNSLLLSRIIETKRAVDMFILKCIP